MTYAVAPFELFDLPGELPEAPAQPYTRREVDLTPAIGGCTRALLCVAPLLADEDADDPRGHLEACARCREAVIGVGRIAAGLDALLYFESLNMETPHLAPAKAVA